MNTNDNKLLKISTTIIIWGILAFIMSIFYYWLKDIGLIWDNVYAPNDEGYWNSRKVILGLISFSSFVLMIAKIVLIINNKK